MKLIRTNQTDIGGNTPVAPPSYTLQKEVAGKMQNALFVSESELKQLQQLINLALPLVSTDDAAAIRELRFGYPETPIGNAAPATTSNYETTATPPEGKTLGDGIHFLPYFE